MTEDTEDSETKSTPRSCTGKLKDTSHSDDNSVSTNEKTKTKNKNNDDDNDNSPEEDNHKKPKLPCYKHKCVEVTLYIIYIVTGIICICTDHFKRFGLFIRRLWYFFSSTNIGFCTILLVIFILTVWCYHKDWFKKKVSTNSQNKESEQLRYQQLRKRENLANRKITNNNLEIKVNKLEKIAKYDNLKAMATTKKTKSKNLKVENNDKADEYYRNWCDVWLSRTEGISVLIAIFSLTVPSKNNWGQLLTLAILSGISIGSIWFFSRQEHIKEVIAYDKNAKIKFINIFLITLLIIDLVCFLYLSFGLGNTGVIAAGVFITAVITFYSLKKHSETVRKNINNHIENKDNK
ncbi:hypothetical protein [Lactobacillus sp. ESL0677]|uniref:hypothetical protein n=1 Tax=Lactobacillus sp. ESL0677 TaxID=2983208 RepID=UPI0023F75AE1|nr:hypothetical protein [Lactobacillus sp. ESL0677]WEV37560.1 hypothetical protein OZX76_03125 [Lactobacillus sp. ESL0677]